MLGTIYDKVLTFLNQNINTKEMTKLFTTLSFLFVMFVGVYAQEATPAQATSTSGAQIEFESTTIDYGTIEQDSERQRIFTFTNTGTEPLIISNAKGSCGCTVPTWPKEPIMPGKKGEIKVNYDTHRIGTFRKTVTLTTNTNPSTIVLTIKGTVNAPATGTGSTVSPGH